MKIKILAATFVALLVLVALIRWWPEKKAPELLIPGIGGASAVDAAVTVIELEADGKKQVITKGGDNWLLSDPVGAIGDKFKINQVIELFLKDISSVLSSRVSENDESAFGLDPRERIRVILKKDDHVYVDLEIGAFRQEQGDEIGDTFVRPFGENKAWRIQGRDLRRPFADGLFAFRSKKVLPVEADSINKVKLVRPGLEKGSDDAQIVLELRDSAWQIVSPDGCEAGDIVQYISYLASLRATEWVETAPVEFGPDTDSVEVGLVDGSSFLMSISAVEDGYAWVKVRELPGVAKISVHAAKSVNRRLAELKNKKVFAKDSDQIQSIALDKGGNQWIFQRKGNEFEATLPKNLTLDRTKAESLFQDVGRLKAERLVAVVDSKLKPPRGFDGVLTVTYSDGTQTVLHLASKDEQIWAWREGDKDLMTLAPWIFDKITQPATAFAP